MATILFGNDIAANAAYLRALLHIEMDDAHLETFIDGVDQDMIDVGGPHSGSHTVQGRDGIAVLQPRADDASSFTLAPVASYTRTERLIRADIDEFTVTYTVDTNEVKRRRPLFIQLLKLVLGYNPQSASLPSGLVFSSTPPPDMRAYHRILDGLRVI